MPTGRSVNEAKVRPELGKSPHKQFRLGGREGRPLPATAREEPQYAEATGKERQGCGKWRHNGWIATMGVEGVDADHHVIEILVALPGDVFQEHVGGAAAIHDRKRDFEVLIDRRAVDRIFVARRDAFKESRDQAGAQPVKSLVIADAAGLVVEQGRQG